MVVKLLFVIYLLLSCTFRDITKIIAYFVLSYIPWHNSNTQCYNIGNTAFHVITSLPSVLCQGMSPGNKLPVRQIKPSSFVVVWWEDGCLGGKFLCTAKQVQVSWINDNALKKWCNYCTSDPWKTKEGRQMGGSLKIHQET